eukprot:gene18655-biopygen5567
MVSCQKGVYDQDRAGIEAADSAGMMFGKSAGSAASIPARFRARTPSSWHELTPGFPTEPVLDFLGCLASGTVVDCYEITATTGTRFLITPAYLESPSGQRKWEGSHFLPARPPHCGLKSPLRGKFLSSTRKYRGVDTMLESPMRKGEA